MVVPGELYPTSRGVDDVVEATEMTGVEHLGQYVYEMTQAKLKQISAGTLALPPVEETATEDIEAGLEAKLAPDEEEEDEDEPGQPEELEV